MTNCYPEGYLAIISYGDELDYRCYNQFDLYNDDDLEIIVNELINEVNRSGGCFQLYRCIIVQPDGKFVSLEKIIDSPWISCKGV